MAAQAHDALLAQIALLERKLGDLHTTDTVGAQRIRHDRYDVAWGAYEKINKINKRKEKINKINHHFE